MADFKISGRMTVEGLQKQFMNEFKGTLRVYNGKQFADPKATLASLRKGDAKGAEFSVSPLMHVGTFESLIMENFGITVQVAWGDNSKLANNKSQLRELKDIK
jgi:hypothetical protein